MTLAQIVAEYEAKANAIAAPLESSLSRRTALAGFLIACLAIAVWLGSQAAQPGGAAWHAALPVLAAAVGLRQYGRERASARRMLRVKTFYESGLRRMQGDWQGTGETGSEFEPPGHPYAADLNLFGTGSVFERISTARTQIGRRRLAELLTADDDLAAARERQEAVRELRDGRTRREDIAALGRSVTQQASWETFAAWLRRDVIEFPGWMRVVAACTSVLAAASLLGAALFGLQAMAAPLAGIALLQLMIGAAYREQVTAVLQAASAMAVEAGLLCEGLEHLAAQQFTSARLRRAASSASGSGVAMRQLERLFDLADQRTKEWFYALGLFLLGGTQIAMGLEAWRARHHKHLEEWIEAWAEYEALQSLACYAYERPEDVFPEFADGAAVYEARGLCHPLLDEDAIRNDVSFGGDVRLYILSGSNMAGKSTLLRAIGVNAVLAYAGAPVRATALRTSRLEVHCSIAVSDSLLEGKSRFLVEVERLRRTVEASARGEVLFLVDELFSGTNSTDRRVAAESVVRRLVGNGAVGVISTHDLALTEIAGMEGLGGRNVHMANREDGGPLEFDYQLRPGICRVSNALAIARLAGID